MKQTAILTMCALVLTTCFGLSADKVVNPTGVTGHDGGNWPSTLGHLTDMLNATDVGFLTGDHNPGIDTSPDPADPSTWTYAGNSWPQEWKANSRLAGTPSGKIGWAVIDLGATLSKLSSMFLWNVRGQSTTENTEDFNVYYSSGVGIDALPAMPNSKSTTGDYDFTSGDWIKLNDSGVLTLPVNGANNNTPQLTVDLAEVSARYIGIEIMTAGGAASRVGIAHAEITRVMGGTTFIFH